MITPTFKVDQDEEFIYVTINTPHVRVRNMKLTAIINTNFL